MGYDGPPDYDEDVPIHGLSDEELYNGVGAPDDGFSVGLDVPATQSLEGMPRAEGLHPFPPIPGCPPEFQHQYLAAYPSPEISQKGARVFSLWGDRTGGTSGTDLQRQTPSEWMPYRLIRSPVLPKGETRLWAVDIWGYEQVRFLTAIEGPVGPSTGRIIESGGASPDTRTGTHMTRLKARVMWWASSGGTTRVVDIAEGVRMIVEASIVSVEILYPHPGTVQIKQQAVPPSLAPNGGTVLDSEIGCSITPTLSTPGLQLATNTHTVEVLQTVENRLILTPPGARALTIFQTADGDVMTPNWFLGRGDPPGPEIGQIFVGTDRRVDRIARPGNAGQVGTGAADASTDRFATFVWELEI